MTQSRTLPAGDILGARMIRAASRTYIATRSPRVNSKLSKASIVAAIVFAAHRAEQAGQEANGGVSRNIKFGGGEGRRIITRSATYDENFAG